MLEFYAAADGALADRGHMGSIARSRAERYRFWRITIKMKGGRAIPHTTFSLKRIARQRRANAANTLELLNILA